MQEKFSLRLRRVHLDEVLLVGVLGDGLVLLAQGDHQLLVHLARVLGVDVKRDLSQVFPPSVLRFRLFANGY